MILIAATYFKTLSECLELKGYSTQKPKFCHHLLTLTLLQTCMSFFLLMNTKQDILKNDWNQTFVCNVHQSKQLFLFFVEKKYYGNQWCPSTVWFQSFFKIYSFVFSRRKKLIQVCNNLRVSKWWQNFNFWVEYPMPKICRWMLAISLPLHHSKHNILLEYHGVNATHTHTHTHTHTRSFLITL